MTTEPAFLSDTEIREQLVRENIALFRGSLRKFIIGRLHHDHPYARRTPRIAATALLLTGIETMLGDLTKEQTIAFLRQLAADLEDGEGQVFEPIALPPRKRAL